MRAMNLRKHPADDAEGAVTASSWAEYVQRHLDALGWDNATLSRVAQLPDGRRIDRSLIGRWINEGTQPSIESIRAVARALDRDIREGLVAAGKLTAEEVGMFIDEDLPPTSPDLRLLSDDELLDEVRRRMRRRHGAWVESESGDAGLTEEQAGVDVGVVYEEGADDSVEEPESPPKSGRDRGQQPQAQQRV